MPDKCYATTGLINSIEVQLIMLTIVNPNSYFTNKLNYYKREANPYEQVSWTHFNLQRNVVGFFSRFSILSPVNNGVLLLSPICDPLIDPWPLAPEANIWVFCSTLFWDSLRWCFILSSCFCFSYSLFFLNLLSSSVSTLPTGPCPLGLLLTNGNGGFCSFLYDAAGLGCLLSLLTPAGGAEEGNGGGEDGCNGGGGGGGDEGGGGGGGGCIGRGWLNWEYWDDG